MKKKMKISDIILPNKSINYFVMTVMMFGMISGSIFLMMLSKSDKGLVTEQIGSFFEKVSNGSIQFGLALRNSLIFNYLFVFIIWGLGLSMIGLIVNIFITYIKGFLVGFSVSSIFLTYGYKGIPASIIYVFPSQIFSVIVVSVLSIYSIMFSFSLLRVIFSKRGNHKVMIKRYLIILMMAIVVCFISSLLEVYAFPNILKLFVKIYIS